MRGSAVVIGLDRQVAAEGLYLLGWAEVSSQCVKEVVWVKVGGREGGRWGGGT